MSFKINKRYQGQSLVDSGVAMTVVGIVSIVTLSFLSQTIGGSFALISEGAFSSKPVALPAGAMNASDALAITSLQNPTNSTATGSTGSSGLATSLSVMNYTPSVTTAIETTGANGSTMSLLQNLIAQAEYYKANGTMSDAQYTNVMSLVQQGYRIAAAEKAIEDAIAAQGGNVSNLVNVPVVFEGKTYSVDELRNQFGWGGGGPMPLLSGFTQMRDSATGSITDPAVKQIVTILSDQVVTVANAFEGGIGIATLGYSANPNDIYSWTVEPGHLNELYEQGYVSTQWSTPIPAPPSTISTNNSNAICNVGTTNAGGTSCTTSTP